MPLISIQPSHKVFFDIFCILGVPDPFWVHLGRVRPTVGPYNESNIKLNDCTKPEYYFGSVLKWIQSNRKFISNNFEELFASYSAYYKFAAYLIYLTCEKVEADLNFITEDDVFLHLIDEILSYDNDFLNLLPELVNCKRPIDILSNNEDHVDRWIKIEFVAAAQTYVHFKTR